MQLFARFALAFATASFLTEINLAASNKSPDHYAKGTQSGILRPYGRSIALPSPVSSLVSGSISLPSPGFFSIFPYGTCSLSVDGEYLALGDGSPGFLPGSTYQAILEQKPRKTVFFRLQDYHLLGCAVPGTLTKKQFGNFLRPLQGTTVSLATP